MPPRLEAVDLLEGLLRPAALNPVSPTEPALPMGEEEGCRARHSRTAMRGPQRGSEVAGSVQAEDFRGSCGHTPTPAPE